MSADTGLQRQHFSSILDDMFSNTHVDLCDEAYEALEEYEWGRSTPEPSPSPATWYFVRKCTLAFHETELRVDLHSKLLSASEEILGV